MSFSTWFWSKVTGVDLQAQQDTGNKLDSQLAALNQEDYQPGGQVYNQIAATQGTQAANKAWQSVQNDESTGATGDVTQQVQDAFTSQLKSELSVKSIFGSIPKSVWLLLGIGLFVWLGGLTWLKNQLHKGK